MSKTIHRNVELECSSLDARLIAFRFGFFKRLLALACY